MNRVLLAVGCFILLIISWVVVLGEKSNNEKQIDLITQAETYMNDEIYVLAINLLEEAAGYSGKNTVKAETELKKAYLQIIDQKDYKNRYIDILNKQMRRKDATSEIFEEAANFYLKISKPEEAFLVLRTGIEKLNNDKLINLYENNRYIYQMSRNVYEDVTDIYNSTIGVQTHGGWGLAESDGTLLIPCIYDKISTYDIDRAIVRKDGEIYAVDSVGNRIALLKLKENALDFGNYANGRTVLLTHDGWKRSTGEFVMDDMIFEEIGTYSNEYVAARQNGKWGVIDIDDKWLIPAEYDAIIMDALGRAYEQESVFVKKGNEVFLFVDGKQLEETYEDAKPFDNQGYAAVKKNGLWGFIDTAGELKIEYQFEDALSFGGHIAAVKKGELWGYINLYGEIVIEPIFLQAKSFEDGNAPVLTERGWQFIRLLEYKKGATL